MKARTKSRLLWVVAWTGVVGYMVAMCVLVLWGMDHMEGSPWFISGAAGLSAALSLTATYFAAKFEKQEKEGEKP